ncbi:GNAT family N-acetyltransferase [Agrobacterium rhizogenes]|nr:MULTISPECIES: GNAT family N-acetyltransferase [Rhizobium]ACM26206.1 adenylate cyclase protein [Rhizobium rhizogenes K84]KAA6490983.1 GNAT family N-acetyltransferase [Agrobacterium sp. ICMP 7243]OCJ25292.1 adenylate cyclase [Agrobacterium sp. B131/95]OCJ31553.1 adenylate cyclase [Agrobacterium sp. B133/95]EJK86358.1 protein involved in cellulose biosynthesis (CelD) [Rhizobium sp. AP16]
MQVDVIETLEDLQALKGNWDRIYEIDPEAHCFLSSTWIMSWFASRTLPWFVLAAREEADGAYVAFLPIQIGTGLDRGKGFYNIVVMGGSYFAPYTGILSDPAYADASALAFAEHIRSFHWRSLHLDGIDRSSVRIGLFLDHFPPKDFTGDRVRHPARIQNATDRVDPEIHLHVTLPADFESFLSEKLRPRVRRNVRLGLRKLDGSTTLRVTHGDSGAGEKDLATLLGLWEKQWGQRDPGHASYILDNARSVLPDCIRDGDLFLPILWQDETPIAAAAILLDRPRKSLICFLSARDAAIRDMSPGLMLHAYTIRWAIENGFRIYDLGAGNYAHKYIFGSVSRRLEHYRIDTRTGWNLGERLDPHSLPLVLARVKGLHADGDQSDVEIGCRQILAVEPAHREALALYRDIAASRTLWQTLWSDDAPAGEQGSTDRVQAERQCRAAIAENPGDFDAARRLSILLLLRGEAGEAEAEIARALELRPDSAAAHCTYGNILAATRNFEPAVIRYDRAIALEPDHAVAHNNKGNALRHLGRPDEALASYDDAIAVRPDYEQALANRAALFDEEPDMLPPLSHVPRLPPNV